MTSIPQISPTLAINQLTLSKIEKGEKVYKFGFGQSPFPVPEVVIKALKDNAYQKAYLPSAGLPKLREVVSKHYNQFNKLNYSKENVIIGPGSKELIFQIQLALKATLLLPSPSWVSYEPQANLLGLDTQWIETHKANNWCLTAEDLELYCRNNKLTGALLLLNYPNHPVGTSFTNEELKKLAAVARQFNLYIIADEIYGKLSHSLEHKSIVTYYPEKTIITSGLSKWCGAGGWRLGISLFPNELAALQKHIISSASETYSCVASPIQHAAIAAYTKNEELENYLSHSNLILKTISEYCYHQLNSNGIDTIRSTGGFYCFPDLSNNESVRKKGITSSTQLTTQIIHETGIALLPGTAFGRPAHELSFRLAFVDFDGEKTLNNIAILKDDKLKFMNTYCPNIVEGINKLIQWTKN